MSLIQQIKTDQLTARKKKDKNAVSLLTTLIGEAEIIGKDDGNRESTDLEVVAVIKKFIKNLNEVLKVTEMNNNNYSNAIYEVELLETYLPTQLNESDLLNLIQPQVDALDNISPKHMGKIMSWLKQNYSGQYDGKMASSIVKGVLTK